MTGLMCHFNVTQMKTASIRELKHATTTVLGWVEAGERVEIRKRGKLVAILSRPEEVVRKGKRPDFGARLRAIYGDSVLAVSGTELLAEERGSR